jgi:3-hydroxyisobutyrate dehydrogenase-like beta-hydroxyacid dehydrogenase
MKERISLGIVGFGEVGSALTKGLQQEGFGPVDVFDPVLLKDGNPDAAIKERIENTDIRICSNLRELTENSEVIFSANSASAAVKVAEGLSGLLEGKHLFVELNSTSPAVKREAAEALSSSACQQVDAAIMGAILMSGHRTPIVASGDGRHLFKRLFEPYGMLIDADSVERIGDASALKMFRSIYAKGIEALIIETLVASHRQGIGDQVFTLICDWMDAQESFFSLAQALVRTHAVHAGRRATEMDNVCRTVNEVKLDPVMSQATGELLRRSCESGVREHFDGKMPDDYMAVIEYLAHDLR